MLKIERIGMDFRVGFTGLRNLNMASSVMLEKQLLQLLESPGTGLFLSLKGIHRIDPEGMNLLLNIAEVAEIKGCYFHLLDISPDWVRLFEETPLRKNAFIFSEAKYLKEKVE